MSKGPYTQLSRLYGFADNYNIVALKNHVMTLLFYTIENSHRTLEQASEIGRQSMVMRDM